MAKQRGAAQRGEQLERDLLRQLDTYRVLSDALVCYLRGRGWAVVLTGSTAIEQGARPHQFTFLMQFTGRPLPPEAG